MNRSSLLYYLLIGGIFLSSPVSADAVTNFNDISPGDWAWPYVERLDSIGLLEPFDDVTFDGDKTVTRFEFVQSINYLLDYLETNTGRVSALVEMKSYALQFSEEVAELRQRLSLLEAKSELQQIEIDQLRQQVAQNNQNLFSDSLNLDAASTRESPQNEQRITNLENSVSKLEQDLKDKNDQVNRLYILVALLGATSILK